jgi:cation transporter-like permease
LLVDNIERRIAMSFLSSGIPLGLTTAAIGAILYYFTGNKKTAQVVYDIGLAVTILTLIAILVAYFSNI